MAVGDAQKHGEGSEAFTTYRVDTKVNNDLVNIVTDPDLMDVSSEQTTLLEHFGRSEFSVRRRFTDFVWLNAQLQEEFPACIVPPLPSKQRMESYITGSRFEAEFITKRTGQLQAYMNRIARHPTLQKAQALKMFLEANDLKADSKRLAVSHTPLESLQDTLLNVFTRLKKPDARFGEFRESLDKLEENLGAVDKLHVKLAKHEKDMQSGFSELGMCIAELSRMETGITEPLTTFANALKETAGALKDKALREDVDYTGNLHAYMAYCASARDVLKLRDQKQLDFEELQEYLTRTMTDRDRYSIPGRIGGGGISGWVKGQYDEKIRGVDPERARLETLAKLERKIIEVIPFIRLAIFPRSRYFCDIQLQEASTQANSTSKLFGDEVAKEVEFFKSLKGSDFKGFLGDYAKAQASFHRKNAQAWEDVIMKVGNYTIEPLQQ